MAIEVLDQATAFTEANDGIPAAFNEALRPHIIGGQAKLYRYSDATEKALINLGAYNKDLDVVFNYPAYVAESLVDHDYVKVYADDLRLRYFSDTIGTGDTIRGVQYYANRVKATNTVFKTNSASARSASFYDRDVQVGDAVFLSNNSINFYTKVAGFVPEVVASSIGSATADAANYVSASASSATISQTGPSNDITTTVLASGYNGYKDGVMQEVYTITCTQASTGGNLTTARLQVVSSSGKDNVASVTPSASGVPTAIGTRGALVTFTGTDFAQNQVWTLTIARQHTPATSATSSGTYTGTTTRSYVVTVTRGGKADAGNPATQATAAVGAGTTSLPNGVYYVGYTFVTDSGETTVGTSTSASFTTSGGSPLATVTVPALSTMPGAKSINIYLSNTGGASNALKLYKTGVVSTTTTLTTSTWNGTTFASSTSPPSTSTANFLAPQVTAVDTLGTDSSGPTDITTSRTATIGSYGIVLTFSNDNNNTVVAGDKFYVTGTASSDGATKTLILADNLPTALRYDNATDLAMKLFIESDGVVIPRLRTESAPNVNYIVANTTVTLKASATTFDSTWTNAGVPMALPIESGTLFLQYRAWLPTNSGKISLVTDSTGLEDLVGPAHPDNPLGYAVSKAMTNSNGKGVYYTAVADPEDATLWDEVIEILDRFLDVYGIVPLTKDSAIIDKFVTHAELMSGDDYSQPRVVWASLDYVSDFAVVDEDLTSNAAIALGTVADNPSVSGTQYTLFTCTTGNAKFVTKGVREGDTVRFLYGVNGFGEVSYKEFTVDSVINEDELLLEVGHTAAVSTAQKFEIWRERTRTEAAASIVSQITEMKNKRLIPVWPVTMVDGSETVEGYHLCAVLAAMAGAVAPQQSLRNMTISGFTDLGVELNNAQLIDLENAGCFTIAKTADGALYVRRARTSDQTSIDSGEEGAMRLLDSCKLYVGDAVRSLYGTSNVVPGDLSAGALASIKVAVETAFTEMRSAVIRRLGGIIIDGRMDVLRASTVSPDGVVMQITFNLSYALGQSTVVLVVEPSV